MPNANRSDHDLLIQIDTKLNALTQTVSEFGLRLASKADLTDVKRLEIDVAQNAADIEGLQRFKWTVLGSVGAVQLLAELFFHSFLKH